MRSIKQRDIPDHIIKTRGVGFEIDLPLLNGRVIPALIMALPSTRGYNVVELIVGNDVEESDIADIEELDWHILKTGQENTPLPPVVTATEEDGLYFVACSSLGEEQYIPFNRQAEHEFANNRIASWPDKTMYRFVKSNFETAKINTPDIKCEVQFYTFREYFEQQDNLEIPFEYRGNEYARYIRRIRSSIDAIFDMGEEVIMSRPDDTRMDSVVVEEIVNGNDSGEGNILGEVSLLSHSPYSPPTVDCCKVRILNETTGKDIAYILFWPNAALGEESLDMVASMIPAVLDRYDVSEVYHLEELYPLDSCQQCGKL